MAALSSFKTEHHYVAGLALTAIGVIGIAGSLTGSLFAMIAGLTCNDNGVNTALYSVDPNGSSSSSSSSNSSSATGAAGPTTAGGNPVAASGVSP